MNWKKYSLIREEDNVISKNPHESSAKNNVLRGRNVVNGMMLICDNGMIVINPRKGLAKTCPPESASKLALINGWS